MMSGKITWVSQCRAGLAQSACLSRDDFAVSVWLRQRWVRRKLRASDHEWLLKARRVMPELWRFNLLQVGRVRERDRVGAHRRVGRLIRHGRPRRPIGSSGCARTTWSSRPLRLTQNGASASSRTGATRHDLGRALDGCRSTRAGAPARVCCRLRCAAAAGWFADPGGRGDCADPRRVADVLVAGATRRGDRGDRRCRRADRRWRVGRYRRTERTPGRGRFVRVDRIDAIATGASEVDTGQPARGLSRSTSARSAAHRRGGRRRGDSAWVGGRSVVHLVGQGPRPANRVQPRAVRPGVE